MLSTFLSSGHPDWRWRGRNRNPKMRKISLTPLHSSQNYSVVRFLSSQQRQQQPVERIEMIISAENSSVPTRNLAENERTGECYQYNDNDVGCHEYYQQEMMEIISLHFVSFRKM